MYKQILDPLIIALNKTPKTYQTNGKIVASTVERGLITDKPIWGHQQAHDETWVTPSLRMNLGQVSTPPQGRE